MFIVANSVGLTFPGGHAAVADADFTLERGDFVALIGPSGCGKSTLLRLLAGLLDPTSGSLLIDGQTPQQARLGGLRVAIVFQHANLLPWRTVAGNIRLPLELQRVPREVQDAHVADSLELIGLSPRDADKRPRMLSGGMRMRVALARALVTRPDLLLMDEPFAALDDLLRRQLNEELARIWHRNRWTGVFVTHNVSEAVYLSRRVLVMSPAPGRLVGKVEVPFEVPRAPGLRGEPAFAELVEQVGDRLRSAGA